MATLQCSKPAANETYQQKCKENSLGQTVPKMTTRIVEGLHHDGSQSSCQTIAHAQTEPQVTAKAQAQGVGETHTAGHSKGHHHGRHHQDQATNGTACEGNAKKRGTEHKKKERKNLLQRIKDSISGDSSSSDSSSESDSDNDTSAKRKN